MNDYEIHETILNQVCKEISDIAERIKKNNTLSEKDAQLLDLFYHTKKDMLACFGMEHPEEYYESNSSGMSGYRGRSPITGRYVSRESGSYDQGYNSGYAHGYSQAMEHMNQNTNGNNNGGNSGHWPMNPYYPDQRRW